jgi:protein-tyrosine phosphatase
LPALDDGARNLSVSVQMAKASAEQGIEVVACTPHILPGLYHNSGPGIRQTTAEFQAVLDAEGVPLRLVPDADVHMCADFVEGLR